MKEAFPNYYNKFKCIADRCRHSCCIGWEIDIDEQTMELYNSLDGKMGERIRKNIDGDIPHFILQEDDRCPFLSKSGLCDIITEYGEDALCDICYLHPRFRNFYSSFAETGLGLCCEEAARIILSEREKFYISIPDDATDEEKEFFAKRQRIFDILQDRTKTVGQRFAVLAREYGFDFGFSLHELCSLYMSLERLDEKWTDEINKLSGFSFDGKIFENEDFQIFFEQLAVYFVFRHFQSGDYALKFMLMSCYLIGAICSRYGSISFEKAIDIARMYSSEVEYSEENTDILIEKLRINT